MLDRPASMRQMPSRTALRAGIDRFLVQSHYRVIDHCRRLLHADDLSETDRNRLIRLMRASENELRYLDQAA
ncbi:MAG TPA: hypothetical protein VFB02_03020 [Bradyrhizobium sp.]|jgi:hypothetical protein|nr:hypothetical protein [Bradyrhizobium sp.]